MRKLKLPIIVLTAIIIISGCVSKSNDNDNDKCIQGDCVNGYGTYQDTIKGSLITYDGDFKNEKLWNGTITKELSTGESFLNVVQDGKEVVKAY